MVAVPTKPNRPALEPVGDRIARLRQSHDWTQQSLAERLGISRVAVSHIEMNLSVPGERTITLLAGLFKLAPHELVEATTYPLAKAERLPLVACAYTPLELDLALMENDLDWLQCLGNWEGLPPYQISLCEKWRTRLQAWRDCTLDERERTLLTAAQARLSVYQADAHPA